VSVSPNLTQRLEATFEGMPFERKSIDLVRATRWNLDKNREARLKCFTHPTGVEIPGGRILGEVQYPRQYSVELSFPLHDADTSVCVARSLWYVHDRAADLRANGWKLNRYDASLGFDPFDLEELGNPAPDPGKEIALFREGFFQPYVLKISGVLDLLDTMPISVQ